MFDHKHYVPVLKGRDGEYGAIQSTNAESRGNFTPLLELPPIRWDFRERKPARTIDEHLQKVTQKIERAWGSERTLFLDLQWIEEQERMKDGEHPVRFLFRSARARRLCLIPVVGLLRGEDFLAACAEVIQQDCLGVCIRIQREDFVDFADMNSELRRVLDVLQASAQEADLLLDLKALTPEAQQINPRDVVGLINRIPDLPSWRTFTMAATSFPENLIGLPPSDCSLVPRLEWSLWHNVLMSRSALSRMPTFGDYAISHPEPSEVDPRVMRPSASVRYTVSASWLILKARNLRDHGYGQFRDICRELVQKTEYCGREFSWGDKYIDDCAHELVGVGNLTTWRKVGTSHHLAFVQRQLANVFGSSGSRAQLF